MTDSATELLFMLFDVIFDNDGSSLSLALLSGLIVSYIWYTCIFRCDYFVEWVSFISHKSMFCIVKETLQLIFNVTIRRFDLPRWND